jgi:TRAP transporter TAXI family solute receptor
MKKNVFIVSLATTALMSMAAMAADTVGIGNTKGGWTNQAGQSLAKVVSQNSDIQMRAQPFGGSSVYVPAVNAGKLEFGLVNELEALYAVTGTVIYPGRKNPNLRVVSATIPFRVATFARADSNIRTLKDLKGKRVPSGWSSQKIIGILMDAQLANAGLTYDDVIKVPVSNVVKSANVFAEGKADVFHFVFGAGKVRETNAKVKGGIRALPFDPSPGALAAARKHVPPAFAKLEKPSKRSVGVDKPLHVMTYWHTLQTGSHVSNDLVYKITKIMHEKRAALVKAFPGWGSFKNTNMAINFKGLTYHPGAIKFYKETNMWPPK